MIRIGLTGWGDHPELYSSASTTRDRLFDYSGHFPIVELDTAFYAIPSEKKIQKWLEETPKNFQFVMKAFKGMTGHLRDYEENPYESRQAMFDDFKRAALQLKRAGKLALVLLQFPPWFRVDFKNVQYIRYVKQQLGDFPIAIEFRNRSWYDEQYIDKTMELLKMLQFTHTVCDEPQAGEGSVPLVPIVTNERVLVRIHGRNKYGWNNNGNNEQWRKVRFLYNYNVEELQQLKAIIQELSEQAKEVYVLFNNNSGQDAAKNAKTLQKLLDLHFDGLAPKQLGFFEGEYE